MKTFCAFALLLCNINYNRAKMIELSEIMTVCGNMIFRNCVAYKLQIASYHIILLIPQCMINYVIYVIIPLIKKKCGDQTDKNHYKPIALSSIISKVFEHIIAERLEIYLWTNDNQFGFKSGHSTDLCIYALIKFIEYYKSRSTSVYVAFLDASKAFGKISQWTLFRKRMDRGVPLYLVMNLCYWYQKQDMTVRWGACISDNFKVTNDVRQGGILSPQLFNMYIDGLSDILNKSSIDGSIDDKRINRQPYALCR